MQLSLLAQILLVSGIGELVVLILVLLVRRRWKVFPFFTAYILFQTAEAFVLYGIHRWCSPRSYFWSYWTGALVDLGLQLLVVFELARVVLKPTDTWVRDARRMFVLLAIAGTIVAAATSWGIRPDLPTSIDSWVEKGDLFSAMLNAQLFLAMAFASSRLGLVWRHHVMGIASGWMLWATTGLFVEAAYSHFGPDWHGLVLDNARIVAFQLATIYWIVTLWLPEPKSRTLSPDMQAYLFRLHNDMAVAVQGISRSEPR